nr:MAG: hypothetical protein DIU56_14780 [Pseudomonadota bacterium]
MWGASMRAVGLAMLIGCAAARAQAPASLPDPEEILHFLEGARASGEPSQVELSLTTVEPRGTVTRRYRVLDDGVANTVVQFLDPLDRGQRMLATPEDIWFITPRIRRAIRIPPAQRLFGEASYGDLARVRWAQDYDAEFDSPHEESADGEMRWRLLLKARRTSATYRTIRVRVTQDTWLPRGAEFYVASGKLLKTAEFPDARVEHGRLRIDTWVFRSTDAPHRHTVLRIESVEPKRFPEAMFTRRYLELHP